MNASPRSFRALVGAQFFGAFNDNLFKQLLLFLAARVMFPGEDKQGLAFAVFALPFVLFSGIAGDLSERFSKRSIIVRMKVVEIGIMGLGAVALQLRSWPLMLGVLFIMGVQSAIFGPAKYGVIPEVVQPRGLIRANGTIAMTTFMAILFGQALAGPLLDHFGDMLWFTGLVCVGFAIVGTVFARFMLPLPAQRPEQVISRNPFGDLFKTIAELRRRKGLFPVVLLYSFFWFDGGVIQQAIVGLGDPGYLNIGADENTLLSYLLVTLALAIMVGCALVPRVAASVAPGKLVMIGGVSMVVGQLGLLVIGRGVGPEAGYWVAHGLMVFIGLSGSMFVVPLQSYLQNAPPPGMRGKTFAVNNFMNFLFIFVGGAWYMLARQFMKLDAALTQAIAGLIMVAFLVLVRRAVRAMQIEGSE